MAPGLRCHLVTRRVKALILLFSTAAIKVRHPRSSHYFCQREPAQSTTDIGLHMQAVLAQKADLDSTSAARECAAYLQRTMPQEDRKGLAEDYVSQNILLALKARSSSLWAASVPWQTFLQYVLPYAM